MGPTARRFGREVRTGTGRGKDAGRPARILIADTEPVFTAGAIAVLTAAGFDPVPMSQPGDPLAGQVRARRCAAVLLDARLGARPYAADVVSEVASATPEVAIIVVARRAQSAGIVAAMEAGAGALAHRGCTPEELITAVGAAISGQNWVAPALAGVLRGELLAEMSGDGRPELSPRERDVLRELATGATNTQIGARLGISQNTVRNHVQAVMRKLGVSTRTDAVATALRQGLLDLPG